MANLGRCLVFYIRYPEEMNHCYWNREGDSVKGLDDGDLIPLIDRVGEAASQEAAQFLLLCGDRIEAHFKPLCKCRRIRRNLEDNWEIKWNLYMGPNDARKFSIGLWINELASAFIPWVWCKGGFQAEEQIVRILGRGTPAKSADAPWLMGPGHVILD